MTPLAAASASSGAPIGALALLGLLWLAGYVLACARWPWIPCPTCHGAGRHRSPSGKAFRDCTHCGGRGRRLRLGRRLWTTATRDRG